MLNCPFSVKCEETNYRLVTYKNAIGDSSIPNGTMDGYELEVVEDGYIHIFYNRALAIDISIETDDLDNVDFVGNQYLSNYRYGNICEDAIGREEALCEYIQELLSDLNALIISIENNDIQKSKTVDLSDYDAEDWEHFFTEIIEYENYYHVSYLEVKEEYLPSFKELKYNDKIVFTSKR